MTTPTREEAWALLIEQGQAAPAETVRTRPVSTLCEHCDRKTAAMDGVCRTCRNARRVAEEVCGPRGRPALIGGVTRWISPEDDIKAFAAKRAASNRIALAKLRATGAI